MAAEPWKQANESLPPVKSGPSLWYVGVIVSSLNRSFSELNRNRFDKSTILSLTNQSRWSQRSTHYSHNIQYYYWFPPTRQKARWICITYLWQSYIWSSDAGESLKLLYPDTSEKKCVFWELLFEIFWKIFSNILCNFVIYAYKTIFWISQLDITPQKMYHVLLIAATSEQLFDGLCSGWNAGVAMIVYKHNRVTANNPAKNHYSISPTNFKDWAASVIGFL